MQRSTPSLLLVSLAGVALVVVVIGWMAARDAGWAVAIALVVHFVATGAVMAAVVKMLRER
jgi:hypothetical protein